MEEGQHSAHLQRRKVLSATYVTYLEGNKVKPNKQFGFRQEKSYVTNLITYYTKVIEGIVSRGGRVDVVYLS